MSDLLASTNAEDRRRGILLLVRSRAPNAAAILERISEEDPLPQLRYIARRALTALQEGHDSIIVAPPSGGTPQPGPSEAMKLLGTTDARARARGIELAIKTGEPAAAPLLAALLTRETDESLRLLALAYFARHGRAVHLATLIPLLRSPSPSMRAAVVGALGTAGADKAWPYIIYLLQDPDGEVRKCARDFLAGRPRDAVLTLLGEMVGAPDVWMRDAATYALAHLEVAAAIPALARAAGDASAPVRAKAVKGLERLAARSIAGAAEALSRARDAVRAQPPPAPAPAAAPEAVAQSVAESGPGGLDDPNPRVRIQVLEDAIQRKDRAMKDAATGRLGVEENDFVISKLLVALGHLGDAGTAPLVERYLTHADPRVAATAIEALDLLGYQRAAGKIRPLISHRSLRIRTNALHFCRNDANVEVEAQLQKMLTARDFASKLGALWLLSKLPREKYGTLVQLVLGDINEEVREKAFHLLDGWARAGSEDAKAMLDMCQAGDVAIKHESLRLQRAPGPRRVVAYTVDLLVFGGAALLVSGVLSSLLPGALGTGASAIALAVATWAFFVRDAFNDGRGFGKKQMGLRCVDLAANRGCSKAQSLIRQGFIGLGLAGVVELIMLHVDESGRRMADRMMNTQVIAETDEPLSAGPMLFAALVYLQLIGMGIGGVVGLFTPAERTYEMGSCGVELPAGWEFSKKSASAVNAVRRSLLRGEELQLEIETKPDAKRLHGGEELRDQSVKMLKDALPADFVVKLGAESSADEIAGLKAYRFDVQFSGSRTNGLMRGIHFRQGDTVYQITVFARESEAFHQREGELEKLLKGLRVH